MSVVQLGAQVSLTPRSGLLVWQAAVQALTSQAVPLNCGSVGEGLGVGVGVGFADGAAGPAANAGGARTIVETIVEPIVKPAVRPTNSATRKPEKSASEDATRMAPTENEKVPALCQRYRWP
jgi:hypothetical protein